MNKRKAIKILEKQRDKLDDTAYKKDKVWIFQTAEYIRQFFGDKSTQYSFIAQFDFAVIYSTNDDREDVKRWMKEKPILAKDFFQIV